MATTAKHTILLLQPSNSKTSRTFMDFDTVAGAMDGLCGMFERKLKELNPNLPKITYDINDLYNYIDTHTDLCALVLEPGTGAYSPYNKDWVKKRVFNHLKKQAS